MFKSSAFMLELASALRKLRNTFVSLLGAGIVAGTISWILEVVSRPSWILGVLTAVAFAIGAVWLTHQVKQSSFRAEPSGVVAVLALGLLTVAVVCAWISLTLQAVSPGAYKVPVDFTAGTFVDLYLFTFLDLLPGIEVLKTLNLAPRITPLNFVGGLPVLGFKLYVIWLFFDAYQYWRKQHTEGAPTSTIATA